MKKLRIFFCIGLIFALLPLSGCKIARTVAAAPFKAIGWSATKVGEAVSGTKKEVENETALETKRTSETVLSIDNKSKPKANFKSLAMWSIVVAAIMIALKIVIRRNKSK
tara:strand:- start:683 stop:1012 length:330 start_codon:yes stop_codon:yes gene_type:complete